MGPVCWVLCIYLETFCLCGLLVLSVFGSLKVTRSLIVQPFQGSLGCDVNCVIQVLCVLTLWVTGAKCARAGSGLRSALCSDFSALSVLAFIRAHTAPGHPFLTVNCVPTGFPGGSVATKYACNSGELGLAPGSGRSPEKGMAIQPIILAWKIRWTEEPGGLQSMESQKMSPAQRGPLRKAPVVFPSHI